jgi:asparagine synthase (glutamine-hydrolysing)
MCGFAGIVSLTGAATDGAALERMGAVLAHRGPDDTGTYAHDGVGFVFRRLSILDVSPSGHQPMVSDDGQYALVFNGEIYNFVELRRELEALGWHFRSSGDTEVLLTAYRQWGAGCVAKFNGMWAFLIHDRRRNVVVGSRDRMGVKPLYRYRSGDTVYLGSEIKAIRASGAYRGGLRGDRLAALLLVGRADELPEDGETFYEGIRQVAPGTVFEISPTGDEREWRFWSVPSVEAEPAGGSPAERFAELFSDSVRLRLRSDVPVGVSMSGGLDSTSVMSVMAHALAHAGADLTAQPVRAFCYLSPDFDESRYITATLEQTGAELHPVEIDPVRSWEGLSRFMWFHDEPVHSMTALVSFEVYRTAAAAGVKVVLGGQGADETAAGYVTYFQYFWRELVSSGAWVRLRREIGAYARAHGEPAAALARRALIGTFVTVLRQTAAYRRWSEARAFERLASHGWFTGDLKQHLAPPLVDPPSFKLQSLLQWSVERTPLPLYLRLEDRNSMAHSVEARLPFMDYRLVEFLFSLPSYWKLRGELNKFVLREGMRGRIPEVVRTRVDKMGFPTSAQRWFAGPLYEPMRDLLASRSTHERGFYDVGRILRDLDRHRAGEIDASNGLFNVAQIEALAGLDAALRV